MLDLLPGDRDAFRAEAEDLLIPINAMEDVATDLDKSGERRTADAFRAIEEASTSGILAMVGVIGGLGAVAVALGVAVLRLIAAERGAAAETARASRAKTDFIADASHELRTPLTVLRGNAEVGLAMARDCGHAVILREIVDESRRMSRLVDDLLFLARSDAAAPQLELVPVDVGELASAAPRDR